MQSRPRDGWIGPTRGIMSEGRSSASGAGGHGDARSSGIEDEPATPDRWTPSADERAIVAAVLGGDREAFRRLVERESDGLVRVCQRILGDHAEAEDAAQEAFVTAYRSLATWRGDGTFSAWLSRIGVRIALRQAGRRKTVTWRAPAASAGPGERTDPVDRAADRASLAAAPLTDPALLSLRAERATEIRAAVTGLPEPYREVVALRFFAGATLDEIAQQTGRPLATVKTHLYRGLARLRLELEGGER
jgi:RNA polymerase sigma-70 factor (ECF subfamily)